MHPFIIYQGLVFATEVIAQNGFVGAQNDSCAADPNLVPSNFEQWRYRSTSHEINTVTMSEYGTRNKDHCREGSTLQISKNQLVKAKTYNTSFFSAHCLVCSPQAYAPKTHSRFGSPVKALRSPSLHANDAHLI